MGTVTYCNPLVPVEWLAAHGLQPLWWRAARHVAAENHADRAGCSAAPMDELVVNGRRGVCPLAAAVVDTVSPQTNCSAVVLTTTCDQMRYAASWLEHQQRVPVFVMNVPSTWRTEASTALYRAELTRLSRFLVACGGTAPSPRRLADVMLRFDAARGRLRDARSSLTSRDFAAALLGVREDAERVGAPALEHHSPTTGQPRGELGDSWEGVPLALAGGPLPESDYQLFDWVERVGGRIVLDATEWGERTLPRAFDIERMSRDPLRELAEAYFDAIPEVFRRPNNLLYEYLGRELASRNARGLIIRRFLWCDLWHAEVAHLRAWSPVPVLDLDAADSESSSEGRTRGRVEAFLEMLR
jgi:benzoyl-CoA reductase/2-hydroxyglutaryl-CoA dehydratase subunit BcrC/BadD/HgdB